MANTTNFGWETPDDTDLVKDGALAMRTLGNAIDTSLVDLKGGTTGQVLSKNTNTDMDFVWTTPQTGDITEVTAGTGLSGGGTSGAVTLTNTVATTFDAKGDLVVGTGADTFAKLVAGSNGDTLVADSSTTTGLRYNPQNALANPVINGGMDIWQRGTSITNTSQTVYTSDRWVTVGSLAAFTISRQTTSDTTNLPNIQYSARIQRNSGQTNTAGFDFLTGFETVNSIPYAGKTITFSFYARAGANYSPTSSVLGAAVYSGTGTDQAPNAAFTGQATVINQNATLTTTWQRFAYTATVASTATQLKIIFSMAPTGTAGANDWFEVTGVQIDVGTYTASSAPTFRRSGGTLAGELAACQRYYFRATASNAYTTFGVGANYSTTATQIHVNHPVQMRIGPASVDYSTLALVNSTGGIVTFTTLTLSFTGPLTSMLGVTGASGLVAGYSNLLLANNSTSGYLAFSAEL